MSCAKVLNQTSNTGVAPAAQQTPIGTIAAPGLNAAPAVRLNHDAVFEAGPGWRLIPGPALSPKPGGAVLQAAQVYVTLAAGTTLLVDAGDLSSTSERFFVLAGGSQQLSAGLRHITIAVKWSGEGLSTFTLDPSYLRQAPGGEGCVILPGLFSVQIPHDCPLKQF